MAFITSMTFRRGDVSIQGIGSEDGFGLRWHRLLLPFTANLHLGPVAFGPLSAPEGHGEPQNVVPLDENSPLPGDQDPIAAGPAPDPHTDAPLPAPEASNVAETAVADTVFHPPYFAPAPIADGSPLPAPLPEDVPPPAGQLDKAEALIWSGPALMPTSALLHEGAAAPDATPVPASDVADSPAPDTAGTPDAVTRADLDPVLAAMGGTNHPGPSDSGSADLSAAFLPPDAPDLPHDLVSGMLYTPLPPIPPPPDMI